jgi:hypothetical protein
MRVYLDGFPPSPALASVLDAVFGSVPPYEPEAFNHDALGFNEISG